MTEIIKYFDCFAGIGGFSCAAEQIKNHKFKFKCVAYCEIDKQAQAFYEKAHNLKNVQKIDDVKKIRTSKNPNGLLVTDFDMLFAGFPCQSFSNVGYRKGLDDERGQLFLYLLDILDYYHPKYFVFENVQKLSTIKRGKLLSEMEIALQEIGPGYHLHTWDLLASDYGLPQKRYRIFFCGIRRDLSERKDLNEPPKVDLNNAKYPTTWHLLEKGEVDSRHYIPEKTRKTVLYKNPKWEGDVNIDNAIARPITATMSKWHRANQDNYFSETYIKSGNPYIRPQVDLETERIRRITPLEGFRLQGFPDSYAAIAEELKLSFTAQYRLIGNALPVNLGTAVIEHFLDCYL
jgi:DNA (cytosine-5)-methyltransferase 1